MTDYYEPGETLLCKTGKYAGRKVEVISRHAAFWPFLYTCKVQYNGKEIAVHQNELETIFEHDMRALSYRKTDPLPSCQVYACQEEKNVTAHRKSSNTLLIKNGDLWDSDRSIVEDAEGYRYKRAIKIGDEKANYHTFKRI